MTRPTKTSSDEWYRRAKRYLRIARANLDLGFADAASFYGQQACEFALKALEISLTRRFSKTHDLTKLADLVSAPPRIMKLATLVSPAYVGARYPDVRSGRIRREEGERIVDASRRIVRWVRRQLA